MTNEFDILKPRSWCPLRDTFEGTLPLFVCHTLVVDAGRVESVAKCHEISSASGF